MQEYIGTVRALSGADGRASRAALAGLSIIGRQVMNAPSLQGDLFVS